MTTKYEIQTARCGTFTSQSADIETAWAAWNLHRRSSLVSTGDSFTRIDPSGKRELLAWMPRQYA